MTAFVALANQKGGVAKTTSAVSLGHGLALAGHRTLLVDLDPQGHVAVSLGLPKTSDAYRLIYERTPLPDVVVHARPNLDIVAGDKKTEIAKHHVVVSPYREETLIDVLGDAAASYDYVLLDLAPSLDVLHVAALNLVDWVIIPTRLDHLATDGINEIIRSMSEIARRGHSFRGVFIVPTFFERTTRETTANFQDLVDAFGDKVWPPVPQDTKAREAATLGKTVWEYCPTSPVVAGYDLNGDHVGGYADIVKRIREIIKP